MELKKKITGFLKSEKGGITKKALINGAVMSGIVFALSQTVKAEWVHTNEVPSLTVECPPPGTCDTGIVTATHSNHSNHVNAASFYS